VRGIRRWIARRRKLGLGGVAVLDWDVWYIVVFFMALAALPEADADADGDEGQEGEDANADAGDGADSERATAYAIRGISRCA
jgi:hypothetical protein